MSFYAHLPRKNIEEIRSKKKKRRKIELNPLLGIQSVSLQKEISLHVFTSQLIILNRDSQRL